MERGGGSRERSGVVVKRRSSSGCLIVKKKSNGSGRIGSSSGNRLNFQRKKDKKRSRVVMSDSGSSDEFLTPPRRRVDPETLRVCNTSTGSMKCSLEENEFGRKRDRAELDDDGFVRRNSEELGVRKKNKLDVFEFDEYDGFDSSMLMSKCFDNGGGGINGRSSLARSSLDRAQGSGAGRDGLLERKKSHVDDAAGSSSQEKCISDSNSDEPIRVQGKNGVLKVMVSKKRKMHGPTRNFAQGKYKGSECLQDPLKRRIPVGSINRLEAEVYEKPSSSAKAPKRENTLIKSQSRKISNKDNDSESEDDDMSMKLARTKSECRKSKKKANATSEKTLPERAKPAVIRERKRRGAGTEKQRLRERIKGMLVDAGWTIDYRPRRNKDYLDAVYVNPTGTAYWSIIKAYDALLKQLNEEDDARSSKDDAAFASISEDILNKLTRKTKGKIETETKKKRQKDTSGSDCENETDEDEEESGDSDTHEEKLRSLVKPVHKSNRKQINGKAVVVDLHSKSKRSLYHNDERPSYGSISHHLHGRKSNKLGRCTLLVRSSRDEKNSEIDGFSPYSGKRTLLSWLIDSGVVQLSQKVRYMNRRRTKVMLEGWITRDGIHCGCCSKILTVSKFEIHAGSELHQPFQNIYLDSGVSLLQCQINAWKMQEGAENLGFHHVDTDGDDPNDDTCGICGDGGDLICCDSCPSTYHQSCLGMQTLPPGDWHCPNCTCKFCGAAMDTCDEDGNVLSSLSCNMCEKKFHKSCMSEMDARKIESIGSVPSFCGQKCLELFVNLQKYLGVKNELEAGFSWSLIHRVDTDSDSDPQGLAQRMEMNSKLAVGLAIMDECFLSIIDRRSGVNLIHNALYNCGSNFSRINYTGFYTAILERGDEIISAASIRFHGTQLAEMPFIGTRHIYRRQGMCRRLFDAIEFAMCSLKVEKLVIPAIPDFLHAWTGNFGFSPLEGSVKKEMRSLNTLVFPGIDMLQKPLLDEGNTATAAVAGVRNREDGSEHFIVPEDAIKSQMETEKKSGSGSSAEVVSQSLEEGDKCNDLVADQDLVEDKIPVLVETNMSTVSNSKDVLPKYAPGKECSSSSSASQIASNFDRKQTSNSPFEDNGQSCKDSDMDVNVEADASLAAHEIQQVSADGNACAGSGVENQIFQTTDGESLDMSSISPDGQSKQLQTSGVDGARSSEENNTHGADVGKLDAGTSLEDQAVKTSVSGQKPGSEEKSGADEQSGSSELPALGKKFSCVSCTTCVPMNIHPAAEFDSCDVKIVQSSEEFHMENGHEANGGLETSDNSSVVRLAELNFPGSCKEGGAEKDDAFADPVLSSGETIAENLAH